MDLNGHSCLEHDHDLGTQLAQDHARKEGSNKPCFLTGTPRLRTHIASFVPQRRRNSAI